VREILLPCWSEWQAVVFGKRKFLSDAFVCFVVGCSNNKKKNLDLWFCRVPKIVTSQGEETEIKIESLNQIAIDR